MLSLRRKLRHLGRYHQITHVFMKHGLGYLLCRLGLEKIIPLPTLYSLQACEREGDQCLAHKLRHALMELGPTFIKLGQMLSTRPDLLPPAYIEELEQLQDKVSPFPPDEAMAQVVKELGPPENVFAEFNPVPLAAASIGQVHLAKLKTGERVVVKIQRPNIEAQVENDLEILLGVANLVERRSPEMRQIGLVGIIEDYAKLLRRELDYDRESKNSERIRHNFADDDRVVIPRVIWEYTTPRVLTEEYVDGVKLNDLETLKARGWDRRKISALGTEAFLTQVMIHGFFQADPHPGNMLVIDENRICFIDFGEVGSLTANRMKLLGSLFMNLVDRNMDGAFVVLQEMGVVSEGVDTEDFQEDLVDLIERAYSGSLGKIDMRRIRKDVLDLAFRYRLKMPSYMTTLMKALITVEGVGKKLDPTFDFTEVAKPLTHKVFHEQNKLSSLKEAARRSFYRDIRPLFSFPKNVNHLVKAAGEGRLEMNVNLNFSPEAKRKLSQLVNRLGASLIIAGGLIGSALIVQSGSGPFVHGYSVYGTIGFGVSLVGLLALTITSRRS